MSISTGKAWHKFAGRGLMAIAITATIQTAGCSEVKFGGMSAKDAFQTPQTVALVEAGCSGDLARMEALVKQGADVNATGKQDVSVLAWVFFCKNYAGTEKLLELGANPNYKMAGRDSPVWIAAGADDPKWLPLMLAHGGDPNIWSGPDSALMIAVRYSRVQNFQLLLDHGVDVNAHDEGDSTAATDAAADEKYDMIIDILNHGYAYQLTRLARIINNTVLSNNLTAIDNDPILSAKKQKILDMLKDRGVKFPIEPAIKHANKGA